jgi:predicted secreted protein
MSNSTYLGNKIIFDKDVSLTDTPEWVTVACITQTDIDGSRETIDTSSKCGPGQVAGAKTQTANFTGFFITDPVEGVQVSMNEIAASFDSGDSGHWRYIDEDGGNIYYREFYGPITSYKESSNLNEAITFVGAVAINGDVIRILPVT